MGFGLNFSGIGDLIGDLAPIAAAAAAPATGGASLMALAPAAIGAAGSLAGGMMSNNANQALFNQGNAFNAAQSAQQMEFQKEMRATQYQTAVEDLKKSGLNPMLAYTQGGAGTPSGAAASAAGSHRSENVAAQAANSAAQGAQYANVLEQNKLLQAQVNKTDNESDNIMAQTANTRDLNPYIKKKFDQITTEIEYRKLQQRLGELTLPEQTRISELYSNKSLGKALAAARQGKGLDLGSALTTSAFGLDNILEGLK